MIPAAAIASALALCFLYSVLRVKKGEVNKSPEKVRTRRQLDELESFLHSLEKVGTGTIGNILCLTSRTRLGSAVVTQALIFLTQRHPLLRAKITIADEGNGRFKKYFDILKSTEVTVPLISVPFGADQWQHVWEKRNYKDKFEENELLWSASILREEFDPKSESYRNTLIFAFHHSIADGLSSMEFTKQFTEALNKIAKNSTNENAEEFTAVSDSLPLLPSASTLIHDKVGFSAWQKLLRLPQMFGMLFKLVIRFDAKWRKKNPLLEAFLQSFQLNEEDWSTGDRQFIVVAELAAGKTKALVEVARKHDTTVNGILTAASHVALCEILQVDGRSFASPQALDMIFATDIRRDCCAIPLKEAIGHYAVPYILPLAFVERGRGNIVDLAKEYSREIKKQMNRGTHLMVHRLVECIGGDTFFHLSHTLAGQNQRIHPESLSNLGRHEVSDGQFQVTKVLFTVSMRVVPKKDTTLFCNTVVTFNGKLYWVTSYDHTLVGRKQAKNYISRVFEKIQSVIN